MKLARNLPLILFHIYIEDDIFCSYQELIKSQKIWYAECNSVYKCQKWQKDLKSAIDLIQCFVFVFKKKDISTFFSQSVLQRSTETSHQNTNTKFVFLKNVYQQEMQAIEAIQNFSALVTNFLWITLLILGDNRQRTLRKSTECKRMLDIFQMLKLLGKCILKYP